MKVILDSAGIGKVLGELSDRISQGVCEGEEFAFVGIRSRGEILAHRLSELVSEKLGCEVECGTLDISLYRDDINSPDNGFSGQVRTTEIGFDINDKVIILVDDVLYTGRSARAALDALIDLGRPKAVRLVVLVDRVGREFPIQADYAGFKTDAAPGKFVQVNLLESDDKDEVVVERG